SRPNDGNGALEERRHEGRNAARRRHQPGAAELLSGRLDRGARQRLLLGERRRAWRGTLEERSVVSPMEELGPSSAHLASRDTQLPVFGIATVIGFGLHLRYGTETSRRRSMTRLAGRGRSLRRRACGTLLVGAIFGAFAPSAGASTGWTREFGSGAPDVVRSVAVDATGIYVAGATRSKLPFGTWAGAWDGFVRKYSLSGKLLWTDQFGTAGQDGAADVTTDGSKVYVVGWTGGSG